MLARRKVSIVADSELTHIVLHAMVTDMAGFAIVGEYESVAAAAAGIREARPDVLLLDHRLADGCGVDLMRALTPMLSETMVIVCTSDPDRSLREAYLAAGACAYFQKGREILALRKTLQWLEALPPQAHH